MNAEQENFEALRKLMALKRHEQPPPGYFNKLPGIILSRLEAAEESQGLWAKVLTRFILRPAFAFTLGFAFCSLFATGVTYSMRTNPNTVAAQPRVEPWEVASSGSSIQPITLHVAGFEGASGTNQDVGTRPSLFNNLTPQAMPASFSLGQ